MAKRRLKIAQIAPLVERVPPEKYGGTERVVWALCEELVARGHKVTLYATADSITSANLVSVFPKPLRKLKIKDIYGINEQTLLNISVAYANSEKFDIVHDHLGPISIASANMSRKPVVMTLHGPINANNRKLYEKLRNPYLVSISKSQRLPDVDGNFAGCVYNGLAMENYPFARDHDGYLLFVGRISMDKGVHFAIEAAQSLDLPLVIAAKLDDVDKHYFDHYVAPKLSNGYIKWIGEVDEKERNRLMSRAMCFLYPVTWREPFGLAMIEAMACGCPVVGFSRGSIPEIVVDGKTGFVVEDIDEMIDKILRISEIKRMDCRGHALANFNAAKMADAYEEIYYRVIDQQQISNNLFSSR